MENETNKEESKSYCFFITTKDNPFNPATDFENWKRFDEDYDYDTCEYLARIANYRDDMTEDEIMAETERAIDEIIEFNNIDEVIYIKIKAEVNEDEQYVPLDDGSYLNIEN